MVAMSKKPKFDPAAHLHKHGWQGKGTALKHGHSVKPLAVVQKKTLSGIGKDRDEAVPFWDHIFAATAASLFSSPSSSTPASPSASPGPSTWAPPPIIADSKGKIISTQQPIVVKPKLSINATARAGRELARRGLYSRFLRGKVLHIKEDNDDEGELLSASGSTSGGSGSATPQEAADKIAGPSSSRVGVEVEASSSAEGSKSKSSDKKEKIDRRKSKGKDKEMQDESKQERRARRAEKKRIKAEREIEGVTIAGEDTNEGEERTRSGKKDKKRKKRAEDQVEEEVDERSQTVKKKDKKRKRKGDSELPVIGDDGQFTELEKSRKEGKRSKKDKDRKKGSKTEENILG
ncbi:uncharacterized protein I303_105547 [Kwoniella dejecticola CBS 10117]|uniref:G-patch domain-containing protein n=1 Tax=Kwoniella dejecticola CBS 10117 TaxID=1296121 RepID=A0A1A6A262_9TREE|nr:uncharacterized protein I303_05010 [Kwoniella dejecticola CBS 10117]OBR84153.1 hypothetical protein I303_05010 [Kwoniella dejecticola CBS 10117]